MSIIVDGYHAPGWNLAQVSVWILHRSRYAVDTAGSDPSPHHEIVMELMARLDGKESSLRQATGEIASALASRALHGYVIGQDGKRHELPVHVRAAGRLEFLYDRLSVKDLDVREEWLHLQFPREEVLAIWQPRHDGAPVVTAGAAAAIGKTESATAGSRLPADGATAAIHSPLDAGGENAAQPTPGAEPPPAEHAQSGAKATSRAGDRALEREATVAALAEFIFGQHRNQHINGLPPETKTKLSAAAFARWRGEKRSFTNDQFNKAYRAVYETVRNKPSQFGWPLTDLFRSRLQEMTRGQRAPSCRSRKSAKSPK